MTDSIAFGGLGHRRQRAAWTNNPDAGASLGPAPTVTNAKPFAYTRYSAGGLQDVAGGTDIYVYGTNFDDVNAGIYLQWWQSGILKGQAGPGGACIVVNSTALYATTPALAAGVYDLVVVNPDAQTSGATGNGMHESWNPVADTPTGLYLPGYYAVTGTPGVDEVGVWTDSSGNARDITSHGGVNAPAMHAAGYPVFDGGAVSYGLESPLSLNGVFGAGSGDGAMVTIAEYTGPLAGRAADYANPCIVCGSGASPNLMLDKSGLRFGGYDVTAYTEAERVGIDADRSYVHAGKWNGTGVYTSTGGETWNEVLPWGVGQVSFNGPDMGTDTYIGMGYGFSYVWNGPIKAVAFYASSATVTPALLAKWNAWSIIIGWTAVIATKTPMEFACTSLVRDAYAGPPWLGTASAGASLGRDWASTGFDPTVGAAMGGNTTAQFTEGTGEYLALPETNATLFAGGAGTFFCLFNEPTPIAKVGAYSDGTFFTDPANAETTFGCSYDGVTTPTFSACVYEGAGYVRADAPYVAGESKLGLARFDGTYLTVRVGRGPWQRVDITGLLPFLTPGVAVHMGRTYSTGSGNARIGILGTIDAAVTYTELDGLIQHIEDAYGLPQ